MLANFIYADLLKQNPTLLAEISRKNESEAKAIEVLLALIAKRMQQVRARFLIIPFIVEAQTKRQYLNEDETRICLMFSPFSGLNNVGISFETSSSAGEIATRNPDFTSTVFTEFVVPPTSAITLVNNTPNDFFNTGTLLAGYAT